MTTPLPRVRNAGSRASRSIVAVTALSLALVACDEATAPAGSSAPVASLDRHDGHDLPGDFLVVPQGEPIGIFSGVTVQHGGYGSSLAFDGDAFYSLSDRGANVAAPSGGILIAAPSFAPQIGKFRRVRNKLVLVETILLRRANGVPLTGLPHQNAEASRTEVPFTFGGAPLAFDALGIDSEGLAFERDGSFWVSDEYGPDISHFSRTGRTIARLSPGSGLPLVLAHRRTNRGMEGLTLTPDGRTVVGMMQSPLDNPTAGGSSAGRTSRLARLVLVDQRTRKTRQLAYLLDTPALLNSEITALSSTRFLVLERDGNFGNGAGGGAIKRVYEIDITHATDLSDPQDRATGLLVGGKTLEELTAGAADPAAVLAANHITPVSKSLVVDVLAAIPTYPHDKAEGLAVIDRFTLAISNDDDFGVGDDGAGHFIAKTLPSTNTTDSNTIYFVHLRKPLDLGNHHGHGRD